jgi:hypothetical protein
MSSQAHVNGLATFLSIAVLMALPGCGALNEQDCLDSASHTLVITEEPRGYVCLAARDKCEAGFIQSRHGLNECAEDRDCEFVPGNCYCPPGVVCICGGGPPSLCRLRE